ncbi:hypothetical protein [Mesorhizobium sp. 1B3]|uniref:hypothetical protein n=1 Tax=Mesorhizobium sp. 1B3 TaxID=3243599 RepID=UPI003D99F531
MKVAILMSAAWRAGMLRNARALAKLLSETTEREVEVVIGIRKDGPYDWKTLEGEFSGHELISLRRFHWESVAAADAAKIHGFEAPENPILMAPRDGTYDFLDCDAWIIFSCSLEGFVVPCRPTGIFCADLIQKYVPEIFGGVDAQPMWAKQEETFRGWRSAKFVFSTTPATRQDVIEYARVPCERSILVPTLIDPLARSATAQLGAPSPELPSNFILWVTNASPHKNTKCAIEALKAYYEVLGGGLDVVICGQDTEQLNPCADQRGVLAQEFAREPTVLSHIKFVGEVSDGDYLNLVQSAAVVWHNVVVDNGTFVAFDAARADRQFVSSDYSQMRYLCDKYGVVARFHPFSDPLLSANALLAAESDFKAGTSPGHNLQGESPGARTREYQGLLTRLFETQQMAKRNHE